MGASSVANVTRRRDDGRLAVVAKMEERREGGVVEICVGISEESLARGLDNL